MLEHPLHEQLAPQNLLLAKHSQYSLRHFDLLQLQDFGTASGACDYYAIYAFYDSYDYSVIYYWTFLGITFSEGLFSVSILERIFLASTALDNDETCLRLFGS